MKTLTSPGRNVRAFFPMKPLIILLLIIIPFAGFGADVSGGIGKWIDVPVTVPEGKIGGGDFYTLDVTLAEGDDRPFEFKETSTGASFKFSQSGTYRLNLTVNHVTKSSCAGVSVTPHKKVLVKLIVSESLLFNQ